MAKVLLGLATAVLVLASALFLSLGTSIREARFPKFPEIVLTMTRAIAACMRAENATQTNADGQISDQERRRTAITGLKLYLCALGPWVRIRR
jgi:hypothetical protein